MEEEGKKYRQFLVGFIVNFASVALGTALGWTSPINPKLTDPLLKDTPLDKVPTTEQLSWIGSLVALGALIAPYFAGPLADKIGRKLTLLTSAIFFVFSFVLLAFASSVIHVYISRFSQGMGVGFVMTVQTMYIGEISSDDCRGALGSLMQLFIMFGILFAYAVGPYTSYVLFQWLCLVIPIIFAGCFFLMPESPYYYVANGRTREALDALKFLRGKSKEGVHDELISIQAAIEEAQKNKGSIKDIFNSRGNIKALIICAGLVIFQQLSGINVIFFYSQTIFIKTGSDLDPAIATILVGVVQVFASCCTPFIVDRLGRKLILLVSAAGMCFFLSTMGLFFYLDAIKSSMLSSLMWLPVFSLIGYVIVYCIGFGPLPWAVLGEMFPANVKSIASSIVASTCWILGFIVTRWFAALDEAVGSHWSFWIFAIFCAIAFVFTLTTLFETKGLSLQQIQNRLNGRETN